MEKGEKIRCGKCQRQAIVKAQNDGFLYCNLCHYKLGKAEGGVE